MRLYILVLTAQLLFTGSTYYMMNFYYRRILIVNAIVCALRLNQRVPTFELSAVHFKRLMNEDSAHYLLFSITFLTCTPMVFVLFPVFLFALLQSSSFTRQVLDARGPHSVPLVRKLINYVAKHQTRLFRFIAINEITILPMLFFVMMFGMPSWFAMIVYFKFLQLRFLSKRNPYNKQLFRQFRMAAEWVANHQRCPGIVKNLIHVGVSSVQKLVPPPEETEPNPPPTADNSSNDRQTSPSSANS